MPGRAGCVRWSRATYVPGLRAYRDVLRDEVLPLGRPDDRCGLSWVPDGDAAYAATLRQFTTTTTKSAQEIHDIGLAQIEKLADEYRSLGPEVVGTDDLSQIFKAMRSEPRLHFSTRRRADHRIRGGHAARVGRDARVVRGAAAGAVCGAADDHRSQGVLLPTRR